MSQRTVAARDPKTGRFIARIVVNEVVAASPITSESFGAAAVAVAEAVTPTEPTSKLAFQLVLSAVSHGAEGEVNLKEITRRIRKEGASFDSKTAIDDSETRQALDDLLAEGVTYGFVSFEASGKNATKHMANKAWSLVRSGWTDKQTGIRYVPIYGNVIDEGTALFVSDNCKARSFKDLGIWVSSDAKAAKRLRRFLAPHQSSMRGHIIDRTIVPEGTAYEIELDNGRVIRILDADMTRFNAAETATIDGMGISNIPGYFNKALTLVGEFGEGKGIYWKMPHMRSYDLYLFGSKKEVRFVDDRVFLGALSDAEEHDLTLDNQTMGNMGLGAKGLAATTGIKYMDRAAAILFGSDEGKLLDEISAFVNSCNDESENRWALVRMAEDGIGTKAMPVGFRRVTRHLFDNILDLRRGRVPMPHEWARRVYVAPPPTVFVDDERIVDLTLSKVPDHIMARAQMCSDRLGIPVFVNCMPDAPDGVLVTAGRNPNACSAEALVFLNYIPAELKKYKGQGRCFLLERIAEQLSYLNGGDMDDSIWVFWNSVYVLRVAAKIQEYPKQPKISVEEKKDSHWAARNRLTHEGIGDEWNWNCFRRDLKHFTQYRESLGTFINRLTLDNMLSGDNVVVILDSLINGTYIVPKGFHAMSLEDVKINSPEWFWEFIPVDYKPEVEDFVQLCITFMKVRQPFLCKRAASNSDMVIDYLQQGKGNKKMVTELCQEAKLSEKTLIFPASYVRQGRAPKDRIEAGNYLLVRTEVCAALEELKDHYEGIMEESRQLEHSFKKPLPLQLLMAYPGSDVITDVVKALRVWWRAQFEAAKSLTGELSEDAYDNIANGWDEPIDVKDAEGRIVSSTTLHHLGLRDFYLNQFTSEGEGVKLSISGGAWSPEVRRSIAVEWLNKVYSMESEALVSEDGKTISVGDGVPNWMLNELMDCMEELGLTGQVAFIHLKYKVKEMLKGTSVHRLVRATNGHVHDVDNDSQLSVTAHPTLPDGYYSMSAGGVIVIAEAIPELRSDFKANLAEAVSAGELADVVF
jgi:hypothetical protein